MNVKELREAIEHLSDDMLVVVQKDAEGNGYSPLSRADGENNSYVADSSYSGQVKLAYLTRSLAAKGFTEDDVATEESSVPCLVLVPVN